MEVVLDCCELRDSRMQAPLAFCSRQCAVPIVPAKRIVLVPSNCLSTD
jgi:hypothetical protein